MSYYLTQPIVQPNQFMSQPKSSNINNQFQARSLNPSPSSAGCSAKTVIIFLSSLFSFVVIAAVVLGLIPVYLQSIKDRENLSKSGSVLPQETPNSNSSNGTLVSNVPVVLKDQNDLNEQANSTKNLKLPSPQEQHGHEQRKSKSIETKHKPKSGSGKQNKKKDERMSDSAQRKEHEHRLKSNRENNKHETPKSREEPMLPVII